MLKIIAVMGLILYSGTASAQQSRPAVPYTITPETHKQFLDYLGEVPAKFANPLIQKLVELEQLASKLEEDKKAEGKK